MILLLSLLRANWKPLAIILLCVSVVGGWSLHERHVQARKDADKIWKLRAELVTASNRLNDAAAAFRKIAAIEQANKAAADAQARAGAIALAQARKDAAAHAARLSDALKRQKAAYRGNLCAGQALPEGVAADTQSLKVSRLVHSQGYLQRSRAVQLARGVRPAQHLDSSQSP